MQTLNQILQALTPWVSLVPIWVSAIVMAGLFILWVWLRNRRQLQYLQMDLDRMNKDLRAMTTSSLGMGGRVLKIEKQQRQYKQQPQAVAVRGVNNAEGTKTTATVSKESKPVAKPGANVVNFRPAVEDYAAHPYDYAIQLARHGASINDIMYQSGVGQNEAKLIHMLHNVSKTA